MRNCFAKRMGISLYGK